jgi:DNA repair exonuclease SbcCD ATPase subunit
MAKPLSYGEAAALNTLKKLPETFRARDAHIKQHHLYGLFTKGYLVRVGELGSGCYQLAPEEAKTAKEKNSKDSEENSKGTEEASKEKKSEEADKATSESVDDTPIRKRKRKRTAKDKATLPNTGVDKEEATDPLTQSKESTEEGAPVPAPVLGQLRIRRPGRPKDPAEESASVPATVLEKKKRVPRSEKPRAPESGRTKDSAAHTSPRPEPWPCDFQTRRRAFFSLEADINKSRTEIKELDDAQRQLEQHPLTDPSDELVQKVTRLKQVTQDTAGPNSLPGVSFQTVLNDVTTSIGRLQEAVDAYKTWDTQVDKIKKQKQVAMEKLQALIEEQEAVRLTETEVMDIIQFAAQCCANHIHEARHMRRTKGTVPALSSSS